MSEGLVDALSYVAPVVGVVVAIGLMKLMGVLRWGTGAGLKGSPVREAGAGGVSMLWVVGVLFVYVAMVQTLVTVIRVMGAMKLDPKTMSATDMVILQGADALVKLVLGGGLVAGLGLLMVGGLKGWGLGMGQVWRGVKAGVMGIVVVYPLLLLLNFFVEMVLRMFNRGIVEHETFGLLKQGLAVWQQVVLFVAAAVVAPFFEELFFRGILQTALVQRAWGFAVGGRRAVRGFEVEGVGPYGEGSPPLYHPSLVQRWGAILITAFLFAAVHGSLTNFPVLFALGVGLGYVYERTGILWASMVMHALFNTINLVGFFVGAGG